MIQITLQFKDLTAAMRALREIPENTLVYSTEAPGVEEVKETPPPAKKQQKKEAAPAPVAAPVPTTASEPQEAPAPAAVAVEAPAQIEYPVLQKAVFALAGKDKAAAVAVASSFGVKTFRDLDASRWAEALAAVNAKIAELGA